MEEYAAIRNYVVDEHLLVGKDYHDILLSEKVGYKIVLRKIQPVRMSVCVYVCVCVHTHDCIDINTRRKVINFLGEIMSALNSSFFCLIVIPTFSSMNICFLIIGEKAIFNI